MGYHVYLLQQYGRDFMIVAEIIYALLLKAHMKQLVYSSHTSSPCRIMLRVPWNMSLCTGTSLKGAKFTNLCHKA